MLTTLLVFICTTTAQDDCQAYAAQRWEGPNAQYECLASIAPTLDALRAEGHTNTVAVCGYEETDREI
jgi:hypothetical protein